jgi:nucleoside 2-deoxyribosyltransferase
MRLYFAAPIFSVAEQQFNLTLARQIEALGYQVFLPQRDGITKDKAPFNKLPQLARQQQTFKLDRTQILKSDIFLFVLDGQVPDEGGCVELGMAYLANYLKHKDIKIIGFKTDLRAAYFDEQLNPLVAQALDEIFDTEALLLKHLSKLIKS